LLHRESAFRRATRRKSVSFSGPAPSKGWKSSPGGDATYFFFGLIPATLAVVVGYFVLYSSARTQGAMKTFGQILALRAFAAAALLPMAGGYATNTDVPLLGAMMRSMHSGGSSAIGPGISMRASETVRQP